MIARAIALAVALTINGCHPVMAAPTTRLHCAYPDGQTVADWRIQSNRYRLKIVGESKWSRVSADAVAPLILMLWADGAKCERR